MIPTTVRLVVSALLIAAAPVNGQNRAATAAQIEYVVSVPEPAQRFVHVAVDFPVQDGERLSIHMSRTSPGRYALHEFAKNVFGETAVDQDGRPVPLTRTGVDGWQVTATGGTVRFRYNVYGDTLNGTYLAVDESHAHLNAPATFVWARGLERLPVRVRLEPPRERSWRVATQLYPTADPMVFTAPNLSYLMDSPIEFGEIAIHSFSIPIRGNDGEQTTIRLALHELEAIDDPDEFVGSIRRIVMEERAIFGELPAFEPGTYTFLADYLPWADSDAMEHRNSSVLTSPAPLAFARSSLLDAVAHEFFHAWNVERIRPRSLEPFNLTELNVSSDLWLAEGFTQYYGPLVLTRAGFTSRAQWLAWMAATINEVSQSPARRARPVTEMSAMAALVDGAQAADRTTLSNTFLSYYTWGSAIALGLDLTLRDRSNGTRSLDDLLRLLWHRFGAPGGAVPGVVDRPYTKADVMAALADVAGDRAFADHFFRRYIDGREVPDFGPMLQRAGFQLRRARQGDSWVGALEIATAGTETSVRALPAAGTPVWDAGFAQDDVILRVAKTTIGSPADWTRAIASARPGTLVPVAVERRGKRLTLQLRIAEHPDIEIVSVERSGGRLTGAQEGFRRAWIDSKLPAEAR